MFCFKICWYQFELKVLKIKKLFFLEAETFQGSKKTLQDPMKKIMNIIFSNHFPLTSSTFNLISFSSLWSRFPFSFFPPGVSTKKVWFQILLIWFVVLKTDFNSLDLLHLWNTYFFHFYWGSRENYPNCLLLLY